MRSSGLQIEPGVMIRQAANADTEGIKEVVFAVLREYGLKPAPETTDADLDDVEGRYLARGGYFEVVLQDGRIAGTAGLMPAGDRRAELRKMYLAAPLRGRGLGRLLLKRMLDKARELGFAEVFLQTNSALVEAVRLYRRNGFVPTRIERMSPRCDHAFLLRL